LKVGSISIEGGLLKNPLGGRKRFWKTQEQLAKLEIIINDDEED